jgi:hypothetical protein
VKFKGIVSASKRFLRTREAVHMLPSRRGLIRHVESIVELHQQIVPEQPRWPGSLVAFGIYRGGLVVVSEAVMFWKRWIRI